MKSIPKTTTRGFLVMMVSLLVTIRRHRVCGFSIQSLGRHKTNKLSQRMVYHTSSSLLKSANTNSLVGDTNITDDSSTKMSATATATATTMYTIDCPPTLAQDLEKGRDQTRLDLGSIFGPQTHCGSYTSGLYQDAIHVAPQCHDCFGQWVWDGTIDAAFEFCIAPR